MSGNQSVDLTMSEWKYLNLDERNILLFVLDKRR